MGEVLTKLVELKFLITEFFGYVMNLIFGLDDFVKYLVVGVFKAIVVLLVKD